MSRIKWNLDQLEEVKRQHDEYMKSTEEVINKGRSDLASMTEEVWEGEDADMAREQYDHLVYREMPDTWRQLDTCNESIQRALKQAYEAKNFCNDYPQIFKSGSMPSETDSSSCSGYFMCDEGNCNQLMSYMDAAGREAAELKRNIESVESILSSLETDEAKFDYASYTEPIKEQSQNVADYTRIYNIALERYVHKVDDLDRALENKLLNATPLSVSQPFDPACIEFGEYIHFRKGDIVNSLEDHNHVDISYSFEVSEVERILEMLFDKENLDISGLSKKDFEIAFLKLSKEKQRAMLHDMGLSNAQIDSILATEQSRRAFANTVFKSGAMDKVRNMDYKLPRHNQFGDFKEKSSEAKEKAPKPSAPNNNVVECDSPTFASGRLMPEYYDEYSEVLIEAANQLCDDDPTNDAHAMEVINQQLYIGFYVEERDDGKKYLVYDTDYLAYCKRVSGKDSLLYGLLDDFGNFIEIDGTVSKFDENSAIPEYFLEISQLGAGYTLTLNVGGKNEIAAYASTIDTARNYFMDGENYDWDAIEEWCKKENPLIEDVEYDFLAEKLLVMNNSEINKMLQKAQICFGEKEFSYSDQVALLMAYYENMAKEETSKNNDSTIYARALCCSTTVSTVMQYPQEEFIKFYIDLNDNCGFKAELCFHDKNGADDIKTYDNIIVYPNYHEETIKEILDGSINGIIDPGEIGVASSILDSIIQAKLVTNPFVGVGIASYSALKSYIAAKDIKGIQKLQNLVNMYDVTGYVVKKSINGKKYANVVVSSFNEIFIGAATIYYNKTEYKDITTEQLRESFSEESSIRDNYYHIFFAGNGQTNGENEIENIEGVLEKISSCMYSGNEVDSRNPNADAATKVVEMYYKMEDFLPDYYPGVGSLEELKEEEIEYLYRICAEG